MDSLQLMGAITTPVLWSDKLHVCKKQIQH